jgi:hypothetical protein
LSNVDGVWYDLGPCAEGDRCSYVRDDEVPSVTVVALEVEFGSAHVGEAGLQYADYGGSAAYMCPDSAVVANAELE